MSTRHDMVTGQTTPEEPQAPAGYYFTIKLLNAGWSDKDWHISLKRKRRWLWDKTEVSNKKGYYSGQSLENVKLKLRQTMLRMLEQLATNRVNEEVVAAIEGSYPPKSISY